MTEQKLIFINNFDDFIQEQHLFIGAEPNLTIMLQTCDREGSRYDLLVFLSWPYDLI